MKNLLFVLLVVFLSACEKPTPTSFTLTSDGIKSLSPFISSVEIIPQNVPGKIYVEIKVNNDPTWGGEQDWNSVANDVHNLSLALFSKPEIVRARIGYVSPKNKNLEWALFFIEPKDFPSNWRDLSYLQFFSLLDPMPGTLETGRWVCEFYKKYSSSMPGGKLPHQCAD